MNIPVMIFIGEHEQYQRKRSIETAVKAIMDRDHDVILITYPDVGRGFDFRPYNVHTPQAVWTSRYLQLWRKIDGRHANAGKANSCLTAF